MLIREGDTHRIRGRDFEFINLAFPASWLETLEALWETPDHVTALLRGEEAPRAVLGGAQWKSFRAELEELFDHVTGLSSRPRFARFLSNALLVCFVRFPEEEDSADDAPGWMKNLLVWIDGVGDHIPSIAEVAAQSERTPEHVARSFRKRLGMTPSQYLNHKRLERAAGLLAHSNLRIKEICQRVGLANPTYFHRMFKHAFELTPLEYRSRHSLVL